MNRIVTLTMVVLIALSTTYSTAQEYERPETTTFGGGLQDLIIEGEPDEHGLIWMIREPSREFESWFVWVYNASDAPVYDVKASLRYEIDGQWYTPNTSASKRLMYPTRIDQGGVGFLEFGMVMASCSSHGRCNQLEQE